jgi:ribosome-associated toxin RatA of RatAB toxin-antitoxin module
MPVVEGSVVIAAPQDALFALSQDYALRRAWDPFTRDLKFLGGAREAGLGVRVWVRAWTGLTMEVEYVSFNPPDVVAMKMVRGPFLFERFAGTWLFRPHLSGGTEVTFRYNFETRWRRLRPLLDRMVGLVFQRDVRARLHGLKRAAEKTDILSRLGASCG